jgi:C1A family cysteine protease
MDIKRQYGWKKQDVDDRDLKFSELVRARNLQTTSLPLAVNNRYWCPSVFDQGQLGSCTANAWAGLLGYNECKNGRGGKLYFDMSRLFIYYNERVIGNTVNQDSGAQLRDGAKAIANSGSCAESEWKYDIDQFVIKPPEKCYTDALQYRITNYYSLDGNTPEETLLNLKTCIAAGRCFVFGFSVFDFFESDTMANTGVLQMPKSTEQNVGGHAVMAIGYNDTQKRFLVRNSWGKGWGLKGNLSGYFTIPYEYITDPNLASDFWTVSHDI